MKSDKAVIVLLIETEWPVFCVTSKIYVICVYGHLRRNTENGAPTKRAGNLERFIPSVGYHTLEGCHSREEYLRRLEPIL